MSSILSFTRNEREETGLGHTARELQAAEEQVASEAELRSWVEEVAKGTITRWHPISGGNRCRSWAVDTQADDGVVRELYLRYQPPRPPSAEPYTVWRETEFYRALADTDVPAPRLIAAHGAIPAIVTERVPGQADFRRLTDDRQKAIIADEFIRAIAKLHALPLKNVTLPGHSGGRISDCVKGELGIWRAMYEETGHTDPLIDLALDWLHANMPDPDGDPVFVHGDAGPGNFLFDDGHMTALLDWELAHTGDPMEDLAWFSMRSVMEPVPDFPARIREYEKASGRQIDLPRILYHRVFVSTRVVIIRHRNVTGEPGNSIVSKALNRRLLIDALAAASGIVLPPRIAIKAGPTPRTPFYDAVLDDLRDNIAAVSTNGSVIAAAKNAAKVLKYLREADRLLGIADRQRSEELERLLGKRSARFEDGNMELRQAVLNHRLPFENLIRFFADDVGREAQIAALSSGGLAARQFPELRDQ
jgi:aminoglycoside phosphotransferase (APT) family kinase protein